MIDCIETDQFTLGILGRSGTRSFVNYITRYYFDYVWENRKQTHLGLSPKPEDRPLPSHHPYSAIDIEDFNVIDNKIMVVRDPIARAKSGIRVSYEPRFHGSPVLQYIDWDKIEYIIDFNEVDLYLGGSEIYKGISSEEENITGKYLTTVGLEQYETLIQEWSLDDFDYTEEISTYKYVMKNKKRLPVELWVEYLNNTTCCNIPSKILNIF